MSAEILGQPLDIHGGGKDLIFPHHENEIAQSEAAGDREFVRYWMHNGFVNIDSEKMSKSLGNFFTIREILEKYKPEVVRFFLLSTHYRSPLDFSDAALTEARTRYERFMNLFARVHRIGVEERDMDNAENASIASLAAEIEPHFREAMDDDFNTAAAIGHLFTALGPLNAVLDRADSKGGGVAAGWKKALDDFFRKVGGVLGFFEGGVADGAAWFSSGEGGDDAKAKAQAMAEERFEARNNKDWGKADELRDAIAELGYEVQDTPQGPVLVPKKEA
jgi:cysteinyl-tRNA synthetase